MFRLGAVGAAIAALLAAGAASATASTSMAPSLRMRAQAVERAHLVPHGFFFSFTTVALQTTPVDVVRNGVTYRMSMTVYQDAGSGGTLQLRLSRVAPDGRAFQSHSYGFSPQSGIHLTYDKKTLQTAALDTTTAITPSQVTGAFTATSVKSKTCRLYDGRMGTRRVATGTMSWSAFDVVTSTAPFFGTIHTQPAAAKIIKDPGCSQGVVVFSSAANAVRAIPKIGPAIVTSAPHERYVQPCFFNRALGAKVGPGRFFGFEKAYRYPQIFQYALRASQVPPDEGEFHDIEALAGRSSLPKPVKVGAGRFEASISASGDEFMTGSATFTSGPPAIRTGLSCQAGGRTRPFARLTYRGTLALRSDATTFRYSASRTLLRDGTVLRTRSWKEDIPRDLQ